MATLKGERARENPIWSSFAKNSRQTFHEVLKLIKDGLYELRTEYGGNIFRVFFIFDEGKIVVLFNGFQKKSQKTPSKEIEKALKIKEAYYADKQSSNS